MTPGEARRAACRFFLRRGNLGAARHSSGEGRSVLSALASGRQRVSPLRSRLLAKADSSVQSLDSAPLRTVTEVPTAFAFPSKTLDGHYQLRLAPRCRRCCPHRLESLSRPVVIVALNTCSFPNSIVDASRRARRGFALHPAGSAVQFHTSGSLPLLPTIIYTVLHRIWELRLSSGK